MDRKRYDAVFFDVGGTLSWSEPGADEAYALALQEHGYRIDRKEVVRRVGVEGPEFNRPDFVRAMSRGPNDVQLPLFPPNPDTQDAYFRQVDAAVLDRLGISPDKALLDTVARFLENVKSQVYDDVLPTLERLRKRGYRLGVISNASHTLPEGLEREGLTPYLKSVTYSEEVGAEKPDPRPFLTALDRMDAEPRKAVHVGDSYEADVVGARAVGITPILIQRVGNGKYDCIVIRSLEEIPELLEGR